MHFVSAAADQDLHDLLRAVDSDYLDEMNVAMDDGDLSISELLEAQDEDAAFERWLAKMAVQERGRTVATLPRARVSGAARRAPRG